MTFPIILNVPPTSSINKTTDQVDITKPLTQSGQNISAPLGHTHLPLPLPPNIEREAEHSPLVGMAGMASQPDEAVGRIDQEVAEGCEGV